jgi:MFS transporter, YNFM family, putative membrane transport protein
VTSKAGVPPGTGGQREPRDGAGDATGAGTTADDEPGRQPGAAGAGVRAEGPAENRIGGKRLAGFVATNIGASVAFTAMYATQPVLPQIGHDFNVGAAGAGLTLLSVTFGLAFASLGAGRLADRFGSRRVMLVCSAALTVLCYLVAAAPAFWLLVGLRAAQGLVVPGITVAGLAFLHNELPASWRGRVSGFYIAANTIGGLLGRLGVGLSVQAIGWRGGLLLVAFAATAGMVVLAVGMPRGEGVLTDQRGRAQLAGRAQHAPTTQQPEADMRRGALRTPATGLRTPSGHLVNARSGEGAAATREQAVAFRDVARRLWWAPLIGGTVFFPFLTVFTYTPYRLENAPFNLAASVTSLVYLVYVLGAVASPLAGQLSDRIGRRPAVWGGLVVSTLGLALSLVTSLPLAIAALGLVCVGSLSAHVVANASVSDSANPLGAHARATALSLYTLGFYLGGGLGSFIPGYGWERFGWPGVLAPCAVAVSAAAVVALKTPARGPRRPPEPLAPLDVP